MLICARRAQEGSGWCTAGQQQNETWGPAQRGVGAARPWAAPGLSTLASSWVPLAPCQGLGSSSLPARPLACNSLLAALTTLLPPLTLELWPGNCKKSHVTPSPYPVPPASPAHQGLEPEHATSGSLPHSPVPQKIPLARTAHRPGLGDSRPSSNQPVSPTVRQGPLRLSAQHLIKEATSQPNQRALATPRAT